jgi:F-type H+-transporting ATPase subunit delta
MEEIAAVYARSLFEVAKEQDKLDVVKQQLGEFADALDATRELQVFLFSPYFSTKEKLEGLDRAVTDADPVIFRTRRAYDALWEQENRLLPVHVTSAIELDKKTVSQIGEQIEQQTGQKVELSSEVDPEILGGIVVRVGNSILDASIRARLENLRKQVAHA